MITPESLMRLAIDRSRSGIALGQTPFGCAIAMGGQVIAVEHNTVWATSDITAHAEINALRTAGRLLGRIHLEEAIVATTCEPCPMCLAALHWARVAEVHFGATIADAAAAGFNELPLSAADLARQGKSPLCISAGLLEGECRELFQEWQQSSGRIAY